MTATATQPPTTIVDAAYALGPNDALDRRHRYGEELSAEDKRILRLRRIAVVKAAISIAKTYARARKEVIDVAIEWLKKPTGKSAEIVEAYLNASDLVSMARAKLSQSQLAGLNARVAGGEKVSPREFEGEIVPRAILGAKDRQAEYHLLRACFTEFASDAAAGLRTIAMAGASTYERSQEPPRPGGWGHPFVIGVMTNAGL